jgi:hypothetical protein
LGVIINDRKHKITVGLDITHYKATLDKPLRIEPFNRKFILEEEFVGFDVEFEYFQNFIQNVDTPEILETVIFPKREYEIDEVKQFLNNEQYHYLFEKNVGNINLRIDNFITANNLTKAIVHNWETDKWFGFHIYEYKKQVGFYFEEVGEQRKGMNDNFWKRFSSDNIYCFTKSEDFAYALTCIDFYWDVDTKEDIEIRKKMFKENFVDKYELNRSWMSLSY